MLKRYSYLLIALIPLLIISACSPDTYDSSELSIIDSVISSTEGPFSLSPKDYGSNTESLPIGVFDSGTGGLAVLEAIVSLDEFNNETKQAGSDNIPDFISESFIYLADEANMPYGRYEAEGKAMFLKELVIKDVLFLAGNKFFLAPEDARANTSKQGVKEIVIACNTATAYGLETVNEAVKFWGLPIKITGIIEAGANTAIDKIRTDKIENALVVVFATEGTCSSGGYANSIYKLAEDQVPESDIRVIQQAGIGLAGSIDGDINYIDPKATDIRAGEPYFGPGINNPDYPLELKNLNDYNFAGANEILFKHNKFGDTIEVQLNSVRNYVRYMVTNLVHKSLKEYPNRSIKVIILGCTHYPYEEAEIRQHFKYLKNRVAYTDIIPDSLIIIDPSKSLAINLYSNLANSDLLGDNQMSESEFYISVPNILLEENIIDDNTEFPFDWKYGRKINTGLQYVKIVPFSDRWIDKDIRERIRKTLPVTYSLIE